MDGPDASATHEARKTSAKDPRSSTWTVSGRTTTPSIVSGLSVAPVWNAYVADRRGNVERL